MSLVTTLVSLYPTSPSFKAGNQGGNTVVQQKVLCVALCRSVVIAVRSSRTRSARVEKLQNLLAQNQPNGVLICARQDLTVRISIRFAGSARAANGQNVWVQRSRSAHASDPHRSRCTRRRRQHGRQRRRRPRALAALAAPAATATADAATRRLPRSCVRLW